MPDDLDLLQGSWSIKSLIMEGQPIPASLFANARIEVERDRFTSLGMGSQYEGTLELFPTANPRELNMRFDAGPEAGNVNLCIHELAPDTWKLCIATRGSVRPTAFASTPGSGIAVQTLQRNSA
jgi:uncharacterized protein (TIGR03067 family)